MVDLHSHALFDIDDGARDIEESVAILKKAEKMGIKKMIVTPHFTIGEDVEEFISYRNRQLEKLKEALLKEKVDIKLKAGAEVYITDELYNECELEKLTLGDSRVILAEFKYHGVRGEDFLEYIDEMISSGFKVLVAHPERYSYLRRNGMLLNALIDRGVMLQINAESLFEEGEEGDFADMLIRHNIAYAIGSDIHRIDSRRLDAIGSLGVHGGIVEDMLNESPDAIFEAVEEMR